MLTACHLLSLPRLLLRFLAKSRATLRASLESLVSRRFNDLYLFLLERAEEEDSKLRKFDSIPNRTNYRRLASDRDGEMERDRGERRKIQTRSNVTRHRGGIIITIIYLE